MSDPSQLNPRRHAIMHHVRQPYGMAILAALALLFVWYLWTFAAWAW